ncbi:retropepsin-like aspartic protease [Longimicrobium sp.]|uniref:retropepsin-like aspartic protease n=1 Tax=Longimicrobium sp. TaxID=2029185 RepID=UPI002E2FB169|nr:retropepsin-like aspartic protease [Longimicrobium sp.]HEX6037147.1 retropepsin-like aspartic protease [Longimicrobium sp.]
MNLRLGLAGALAAAVSACAAPAAGPAPSAPPSEARLAELYHSQDCFGLRDALAGHGGQGGPVTDFYRAAADVAFSRPEAAIPELRRFLASPAAAADDRRRQTAYELLGDAYVRTYRYGEAAQVYAALAGEASTDSAGRENAANVRGLWGALAGTPAQTVELPVPVRVATRRDRANLVNVAVEANGQTVDFVWDTGANLSTITESTAGQMGVRVLDATVNVGSSTGTMTRAHVGVAPELRIGGAAVRNAVFLVFPDSALAFPQIGYQIRGIIGFPVISAFGATTVLQSGELVLGDTAGGDLGEQNLCMRGLMPIIAAEHGGQRLHFGFDTGAQSTSLYMPFHAARRALVEAGGAPTTVQTGGAGGMREVRAYALSPLVLRIGGREATVPQVRVFIEPTTDDSDRLFGNIGQDVIRQFEAMTLDFRRMQIRFR